MFTHFYVKRDGLDSALEIVRESRFREGLQLITPHFIFLSTIADYEDRIENLTSALQKLRKQGVLLVVVDDLVYQTHEQFIEVLGLPLVAAIESNTTEL